MLKIYTKTGDDGTTGLYQRGRIEKNSEVIEAIGAVDELNSFIGLLSSQVTTKEEWGAVVLRQLAQIQNHLFDIGAAIAAPLDSDLLSKLSESLLPSVLENRIDEMDAELAPIKQFILPGGTTNAAATHVCRSVCRNAERRILSYLSALTATKNGDKDRDALDNGMNSTGLDSALPRFEVILKYMNRLSDYFFVLARFLNFKEKCTDVFWKPIDQS